MQSIAKTGGPGGVTAGHTPPLDGQSREVETAMSLFGRLDVTEDVVQKAEIYLRLLELFSDDTKREEFRGVSDEKINQIVKDAQEVFAPFLSKTKNYSKLLSFIADLGCFSILLRRLIENRA